MLLLWLSLRFVYSYYNQVGIFYGSNTSGGGVGGGGNWELRKRLTTGILEKAKTKATSGSVSITDLQSLLKTVLESGELAAPVGGLLSPAHSYGFQNHYTTYYSELQGSEDPNLYTPSPQLTGNAEAEGPGSTLTSPISPYVASFWETFLRRCYRYDQGVFPLVMLLLVLLSMLSTFELRKCIRAWESDLFLRGEEILVKRHQVDTVTIDDENLEVTPTPMASDNLSLRTALYEYLVCCRHPNYRPTSFGLIFALFNPVTYLLFVNREVSGRDLGVFTTTVAPGDVTTGKWRIVPLVIFLL